jgi:hypothetical protein
MMRERGLDIDRSIMFRWVQRYAPEINKRIRPHLKMSGTIGITTSVELFLLREEILQLGGL